MNARKPYDEENETEKAWFWVVFSHMGGGKSDLKEIARLLRLGQPIPKIAQNFLADLIDPPRGGGEDLKLVLEPNDRQGKLKTELEKFQKVVRIVAAMNRGHAAGWWISAVEAMARSSAAEPRARRMAFDFLCQRCRQKAADRY